MDGLVHTLDSKTLWIEFGIDDSIIVCCSFVISISHLSLIARSQPFTSDFPRGDIYQMVSPDLLHQVIKGTFKDHLVTWICEYLVIQHGECHAGVILDDIDRRYVLPPAPPNEIDADRLQNCCSAALSRSPPISSWQAFQAMDRG